MGPGFPVVDGADGDDLGSRAGQECLIGQVQVGADDGLVSHLVAQVRRDRLDGVLRDAGQRAGVGSWRGHQESVVHNEDVLARALTHRAVGCEQNGLVIAGLERLHLGQR